MKPESIENAARGAFGSRLTDLQCRIVGSPIEQRAARRARGAAQITLDALMQVMEETMRLTHEGYDIAGLEVRNGMPVIELVPTARLAEMAHHEHGATYIAHSLCDGVRKRTGELLRRTCRVIWIEKGE